MSINIKSSFEKIKTLKIIVIVVIVFSIAACNVNTKNDTTYYHVTQIFKDYCFYKTGSSWTYQNDKTGATFNLAVKDINSYVGFQVESQQSPAYSYDAIEILYDTNNLKLSKGLISAGPAPEANEISNDLYRLFWNDGSFILAFAPGFPMGVEQRLGGQEGIYTNLDLLPNYTINNKDYSNVYHSQVLRAETNSDTARYEFYFAPHTGLIHWLKVLKGVTTSYSLKKAQIIQ